MRHDGLGDITSSLDMLGESMIELRRISHHLMPEALQREGLRPALAAFCRSLPGVKFGWFGLDERLESNLEVAIYRIVHELVNNALKHARASEILVHVMREADYIAVIVRDNGIGFDPTTDSKGMGLHNIRHRVSSGGGRMLVDSRPGEGTEINIQIKLK
jgi:signal transduction histidine kinase